MRIWYDAVVGKDVRYCVAIAKRLRESGHKMVSTTREHPDTVALAKLLDERFEVIGEYDPTSLISRLRASAKRLLLLCEMFKDDPPQVAIAQGSVELHRVAFGLGIPVISTHDTPHSEAVKRLTLPLADFLVVSKAVQPYCHGYGARNIVPFDGVDEVAWIRDFEPKQGVKYEKPLIVVRQLETKAVYAQRKIDETEKLARKLTSLGQVVFLPRYDKHPREGLIVPQQFVDATSLVGRADLVLSVGGTLAREAALQGIPSIVIPTFRTLHVNNYLSKRGFPLFTVELSEAFTYAKRYIGKKTDVSSLLAGLEDPVDVIEKIIEDEIC